MVSRISFRRDCADARLAAAWRSDASRDALSVSRLARWNLSVVSRELMTRFCAAMVAFCDSMLFAWASTFFWALS